MRWPWDICVTCSITQGSVAKVLLPLPWIPCSYDRGPVYLGFLVLRGGSQPGTVLTLVLVPWRQTPSIVLDPPR